MSDHDIYRIIESLDAAQKSAKQLPALFKPAQTSPQLSGPYPGRNATRGYLVGEDAGGEDNPMIQAVHRRIVFNRPEWITKYGVDAIDQAVIDVVGEHWDGEEIGSSDVSAYVHMIGDLLRDRGGSREEMADRRPFAEHDGRDDEEEEIDDDGMTMADRARRDGRGDDEWHISPSGAETNMDPSDDDYEINYGPEGLAGKFQRVAETSDYSRRREREEEIISGKKPARKKSPAQTSDYNRRREQERKAGVREGAETATEDVISTVKRKLGDYLQDVATAIQKDPDLLDKVDQAIDQVGPAVKTVKTDDGHEIRIHGNEDDGFRISIRNRPGQSKFKNLDEAVMACEMYCAHRRNRQATADYIEEKRP